MADYVLNLDSIANVAVRRDYEAGPHVVLAEVERDALVAEVRRLRVVVDAWENTAADCAAARRRLRGLLARAIEHIDPNDSHEDYLLLVECQAAIGGELEQVTTTTEDR